MTLEFGCWAFQYPAIHDVWTEMIPDDTDLLVVHGPPALYGDCDGEKGPTGKPKIKGDGYLLREVKRVQPKLVICGHIHGAFGITRIELNGAQDARDAQQICWEGYGSLQMLKALWSTVKMHSAQKQRQTLIVNAAFAPSAMSSNDRDAICVDLGL